MPLLTLTVRRRTLSVFLLTQCVKHGPVYMHTKLMFWEESISAVECFDFCRLID